MNPFILDTLSFTALLEKLGEKLQGWLESFFVMLPNLLIALLVVVAFAFIARFGRRYLTKLLVKTTSQQAISSLMGKVFYLAILAAGVFIALGILDLRSTVTSLLAGVGIVGLALGFAFQDIAANFMSGIFIAVNHPFRIGDLIKTGDFMGTVTHISLRTTTIRSFQGQVVLMPNKELFQNPLINYSTGERRVDLAVGVSYGDDLEKAKRIAIEAVKSLEACDPDKPVQLFFEEFGGSSINFSLRFWLKEYAQPAYLEARSQAVMAVKTAFDQADISIPFPIRTLDFGIRGGESLKEMLPEFSQNGETVQAA